jgi:putative hydrolase
MAQDQTPDPADQPEDDETQPREKPSEPYRLGGSGGSGKSAQGPSGKSGGEPDNPFEAFLASLAGGDMNALAAQLQSAFAMLGGAGSMFTSGPTQSGSGVNWEVTKDTARKTAASLGPDPSPDAGQQRAITEAVELAEVWLYQATAFPRVSTSVTAWSRADWIEQTMPVWRRLVEPVALHIADAMEGALNLGGSEETSGLPGMAGMEQMLRPMLRTSGASMFGLQLGQGLGQLATEVVGATDIGLPLSQPGHVALLPTNIKAFGDGLEQSSSDVTLYLALRECARQRLFASAGWLRAQMLTLVEQYASGITIDTSALEQAVSQLDASNLEELSSSLEGGLFEPQKTPEQLATLERLETMLALVEGWVDEVVTQATADLMPSAPALGEAVRRARATGGPAEETFATLVGLELRPRRMRDAANLWAALRDARGVEGRDTVWSHPDLVPTSADLDDPLGFVTGDARSESQENPDFDAALEELLKGEGTEGDDDQSS